MVWVEKRPPRFEAIFFEQGAGDVHMIEDWFAERDDRVGVLWHPPRETGYIKGGTDEALYLFWPGEPRIRIAPNSWILMDPEKRGIDAFRFLDPETFHNLYTIVIDIEEVKPDAGRTTDAVANVDD